MEKAGASGEEGARGFCFLAVVCVRCCDVAWRWRALWAGSHCEGVH
jgi:hypothetical protein